MTQIIGLREPSGEEDRGSWILGLRRIEEIQTQWGQV
jgi:hypothetical protein